LDEQRKGGPWQGFESVAAARRVVADLDYRLLFASGSNVARKDVLEAVPEEGRRLARQLWARRVELNEWLEADPEHAQRLLADPQTVLQEALPGLEVPDMMIPGAELRDQLLEQIPIERVTPKLEQLDPAATEALKLLGRLLENVADGTTTPEQIAQDPHAAARAVADAGTSAEAINRLVEAIRFVLGLRLQIEPPDIPPIANPPLALEAFATRVRPQQPR
jgi:hypothetical protein